MTTGRDGVTSVLRTAELWSKTAPVPAASLPSSSLDTQRQPGQSRPVKHRAGKSQVSPLLRSGLLANPSLQGPVWAGLLGLSRNRKVYLTHCRQHGTDPLPPMSTSWRLLNQERPDLTEHLRSLGATCREVFWPALRTPVRLELRAASQ